MNWGVCRWATMHASEHGYRLTVRGLFWWKRSLDCTDQFTDPGKMIVIVLTVKEGDVDDAHGLLEAGMQG